MSFGLKAVFTAAVVMIGIAVCFVDPNKSNGPRPNNVMLWLAMRPDGTLRKHAKTGILIWFGIFLLTLWLLPS